MSPSKMEKKKGNISKQNENKKGCCKCHMNSLSSFSYCIVTLGLTAFIITTEVQQLFKYLSLPWPDGQFPELELNIFIGLLGAATALIPFFFCTAIFKIGNFANDGFRLGVHDSGCSKDPPPLPLPARSFLRAAWRNGGPTAPFIHLIISQALIIARLVMETAATRAGYLPKETVWSSELSFLLPQRERISILDIYSSNLDSSSSALASEKYESSSMLLFPTSSNALNHGNRNQTPFAATVITPTNGGDVWHIGEIPWGPFTPHLINYLLAHLVYAGKYAAVFWGTNKAMGLVFFMQLLLSVAQSVFTMNGFQVLYKIQAVGINQRVLPMDEGFIVPILASVGLYLASQTMVLASGSVIYLYGYVKFEAFLNTEREKYHILTKHGHEAIWSYWPHCSSLAALVLMTLAASPLIYDWTIVYRSSLDSAALVAICGTVGHLFLWILFWMALTIKSRWVFKLRVQVSKTIVSNTHSIRLVNEVQLSQQAEESDGPVMVIGSGKTYLLQEDSPKRALMRLVLTTLTEKKARGEEEEIYWLRPKGPPLAEGGNTWTNKGPSPGVKHKVTFNDVAELGSPRRHNGLVIRSNNGMDMSDSETSIESDGDYARLRAVSFPGPAKNCDSNRKIETCSHTLGIPTSSHDADAVSIGTEFPAPPPELTNPAHYPPPPDSPPPPLPSSGRSSSSVPRQSAYSSSELRSPQLNRVKNHAVNVVRRDFGEVNGHMRDSGLITDCHDSSSTTSSVTPPDKRSDSGVHSQTSTGSSSGTHSKSGSSGSESCVPPPQMPENCLKVTSYNEDLPPPPPAAPQSAMTRCSSVDELCSLPPAVPRHANALKTCSLQHGALPPQQQYEMEQQNKQQVQQYQQHQNEAQHQHPYHQQQSYNNNNVNHQQKINEKVQQQQSIIQPNSKREDIGNTKIKIQVLGGGYGFLPPAKFVASEPVYSDASTPVAIRRRSSISAIEPETPAYERSAASFSTFTEPQLPQPPQPMSRVSSSLKQSLSSAIPGKAMTVGGQVHRNHRQIQVDTKHATIGVTAIPKGFHQPSHIDSRYFSVPAVKHQV